MCNTGCTVTFTKINYTISYYGHTIVCGSKCTRTGLLMVPLTKNVRDQATIPLATTNHAPLLKPSTAAVAANNDTTSSAAEYARYIHQIMCYFPASTLLRALDLSKELATIPRLTTTLIKNHLSHSTATKKGHMQQHQANTASTRNMQSNIIAAHAKVDCMFPPHKICAMQDMFCFAALADAIMGPMYTNITGAFTVCSFKSMQYVFVAYIYNLNAIIVRAMQSCTDASKVQAFTKVISMLKSGGYHPAQNVMDNKCSTTVKKYRCGARQCRAKTLKLLPFKSFLQ
jgi:hypothetical protein